jgi:hypothetical protein
VKQKSIAYEKAYQNWQKNPAPLIECLCVIREVPLVPRQTNFDRLMQDNLENCPCDLENRVTNHPPKDIF